MRTGSVGWDGAYASEVGRLVGRGVGRNRRLQPPSREAADCAPPPPLLSRAGALRRSRMKGLILVGGLGTQLRPLTLSKPKPLIEFGNKPHLEHLLDLCKKAGVTEVVLAISYRPEIMAEFLEKHRECGVKITLSQETEPLGTAGPIALAKEFLDDGEPFFVMNCDVACEFSLRELLEFHTSHGRAGTIMVTRVDEPAKYGKSVVVPHETGLIDKFVEHGERPAPWVCTRMYTPPYCNPNPNPNPNPDPNRHPRRPHLRRQPHQRRRVRLLALHL